MIYLIANWKMQLSVKDSVNLATKIIETKIKNKAEIILCPSSVALDKVKEVIEDSEIKLGAQNVYHYKKGNYTGEISPLQLKEIGVKYVIIGHSERRKYLSETDEDVNLKIKICLENNLTPILCVGETLSEKNENKTDLILIKQISKALESVKLKNNQKIIIAYEPVWAIGVGRAVNQDEAEYVAKVINHLLLNFFDKEIINKNISIIYGGSVNAKNIDNFIKSKFIKGVLVGTDSFSYEKFLPIINKVK